MPFLTLKIDVDTFRGTREGAPNLARILRKHHANASFLFSLGPDHTGWALRRAFRPGFFQKVSRTSVLEHYGVKTLMYGTLLPAPDIGKACMTEMRAIQNQGFECGIHTWDHVSWQDNVRRRDGEWTRNVMQRAFDRFSDIFGHAPKTHGAAGWQMNEDAFAQLDKSGIGYSSDGRAMLADSGAMTNASAGPHRVSIGGETLSCIQMPTTLPTLDEMLGRTVAGVPVNQTNIAAALLELTENNRRDHVYTLHAELEGQKLASIFEQLLDGWRTQGYDLVSMAGYYRKIKDTSLPVCAVAWGEVPGRSGNLIIST